MNKVKNLTPKQEDRRHRILSAARDMVADHGYDGMVMSQVADRAGVSPTTLYNLYNTKDELVLEALRELLSENSLRLSEAEKPGWQFLLRSVKNGAWMATTEPAYAEAITHAMLRANPGDALIKILLVNPRRDMLKSIHAMAERGELRAGINPEELATSTHGVYWSTFTMWNKGLVHLQDLEHTLQMNFLSMMIPATVGDTRKQLEALYDELLDQPGRME